MFGLKIPLPGRLYKQASDKTLPLWMRIGAWIVLIAFQVAFFGNQISHFAQLSKPGNELYTVGSGVLYVVSALLIALIGLGELKRAGAATGQRGLFKQMAYILLRTFLFLLLPCMLITSLLITWAVLTHQPAFR